MNFHLVPHLPGLVGWGRKTKCVTHTDTTSIYIDWLFRKNEILCNFNCHAICLKTFLTSCISYVDVLFVKIKLKTNFNGLLFIIKM